MIREKKKKFLHGGSDVENDNQDENTGFLSTARKMVDDV